MINELNKVKDKVEHLLQTYPVLRDDDKKLWLAYLTVFCSARITMENPELGRWEAFKKVILDHKTPSYESIRRTRQKFQESGKYIGSSRPKRMAESDSVKDWAIGSRY